MRFPVACPLHRARDLDGRLGGTERRDNAIFACYQAMRLAALLMLAGQAGFPAAAA